MSSNTGNDCGPEKIELDHDHCRRLAAQMDEHNRQSQKGLDWLTGNMPPYFFITMQEEDPAVLNLAADLHHLPDHRKITLIDREDKLMLARRDRTSSVYDTLRAIEDRHICYSEMTHSTTPIPGAEERLEVFKFEFRAHHGHDMAPSPPGGLPRGLVGKVRRAAAGLYPRLELKDLGLNLRLISQSSPTYVRISPPERLARLLWLYRQCRRHDGLFLDLEDLHCPQESPETRLMFSVGNPPQRGFIAQVLEIFDRLEIGVRRFYALDLHTDIHPFFLGTFYAYSRSEGVLRKDSPQYLNLEAELYNSQILDTENEAYRVFLPGRIMNGQQASLTNTFIEFCHTNLAHTHPDRFDRAELQNVFYSNPEMTLKLIELFNFRFQPGVGQREAKYQAALEEATRAVDDFNTGFRRLDQIRRTVYRTALILIRFCLKTNFFVIRKHALAFRLDPAYLEEMESRFTTDLPRAKPFRITFFFSRHGAGYHIGFSDIARGGWRTVICRNHDRYVNTANNIFREVFVLAHTQHLKNKDIYEGGSKMGVYLDARQIDSTHGETQRLYKLQYGFINAFLDLFVTKGGKAADPMVIDYYGDDEPIELGPDENMHDLMIEFIAYQAQKRGYLLGMGIMSSKEFGINHKEYGVTSRGVIKAAEIALARQGVDMASDPFTVRLTGGPRGDVAGNAMKLILQRCPRGKILSMIDSSGGIFDPAGIDHTELDRRLLVNSIQEFDPQALHPGGYILYRRQRKGDRLRELHRKVVCTDTGLQESWVTMDEFHKQMDHLLFSVPCDLFLPCGGRPETIDESNWERLLGPDGTPGMKSIVEGANSFFTPQARDQLQKQGVVVLLDASANKCGVISSSYEIMANLLLSQREFMKHKEVYVNDVLEILERRASDETKLIFARHDDSQGARSYTEISQTIARQINAHYTRLFCFFGRHPQLAGRPLFRKVLRSHLPRFISESPRYRARIKNLPPKIQCAILAVEIAVTIVYKGGWDSDLEGRLRSYLGPRFG